MQQRALGRSEITVSELCLGCMTFGTQLSKETSFRQLDRAFEAGITTFDTAEMYSVPPGPDVQGLSERILGEWINARGLRNQVGHRQQGCGPLHADALHPQERRAAGLG